MKSRDNSVATLNWAQCSAVESVRYQQNLEGRRIALAVLSTPRWPVVKLRLERIAAAVDAATAGSYIEVDLT
jgi:hypothetical protein